MLRPAGPSVRIRSPMTPMSDEGRKQQGIGPNQKAGRHAGNGAGRGGASPHQAPEEGRCQLRDGGEGKQADRGELSFPG